MTRQEIFDAWARPWHVWSLWVKPVVFASLPESVVVDDVTPGSAVDLSWMPPIADRTAIVLDLPGAEAAIAGLSLAEKGYIPVPLYNAHPGPGNILKLEERETPLSVVEVGAIAAALVAIRRGRATGISVGCQSSYRQRQAPCRSVRQSFGELSYGLPFRELPT
jgi:hypothetical protein